MRTLRTVWWLLASLPALGAAACVVEDADNEPASPFDESDNDDSLGAGDGKADAIAGYRSGCNDQVIRTGRYALRGDIVTPSYTYKRGYVIIDGEKIAEVRSSRKGPGDVTTIVDTEGVIFPGLIDAHNHVEYNVLPLLDTTKRYQNRDQWPRSAAYEHAIKDPRKAVSTAGLTCQAIKHGEIRALVGGTTSIQGTPYKPCVRPLVRNIEQTNFCRDRVKTNVMAAISFPKGDPSFSETIHEDLAADELDAFVVHLAEGIDDHAHGEWKIVSDLGLVVPELVTIHGTALTGAEFDALGAAGGKLAWSPLSNFYLYGQTTDVPRAMQAGVLVSLGADWAPSGSANVLAELKVADRVNKVLWGSTITDKQLVQMVTKNPALTFGASAELGAITAGRYADLMVVRRPPTGVSVWRGLIDAHPEDVLLVVVAGDPLYGVEAFLQALGKQGDYELVDACGTPRAIDVTVTASDVPGGSESLASIESQLSGVLPELTPIFDCTGEAAQRAYAGTPLEP